MNAKKVDLEKTPYIGEIVHYFNRTYQICAALVTEVFPLDPEDPDYETGYPRVNLMIFAYERIRFYAVNNVPHYSPEFNQKSWCFKGEYVPQLTNNSLDDYQIKGSQSARFHKLIER